MNLSIRKRGSVALLLSTLLVVLVATGGFAATPLLRGEMEMEIVADESGITGQTRLNMAFDIGLSGVHRARIQMGTISGQRTELGSANRLWTLNNQVTIAYLEHTGAWTDTGKSVRTRFGDVFVDLSRNVGYVANFQGIQVRGIGLGDHFEAEVAYGWNPQTSASPEDTVQGFRLDGHVWNTDVHYVLLNSESLDTNLLELGIAREFGPVAAHALFLDNGTFNAYQFGAAMPVRDWTLSGAYTDWGPFDTPYTGRSAADMFSSYGGKYGVFELKGSGPWGPADVAVGFESYDDLMDIQRRLHTDVELPVRDMTLKHGLTFNQNTGKVTKNRLSLAGSADVRNWLRDVKWNVAWDLAKQHDAFVASASYTAPNRITTTLTHRSDSGPELRIASKLSF